ncbi:MAG: mercury(II) reductase [Candidatus Bathyarchaeota archaeon]|nr:mercury(II) reductase [Candidatus Bathyarchaeota archaeon]
MDTYDLVILGSGSASFAAAIKASELKKQVAMIEYNVIGGTCVNVGCVPSKHLLTVGDTYYHSQDNRFQGITTRKESFDFSEVIKQKDELVKSLRKEKYSDVVEYLPNVIFIKGTATFVSRNEIKVNNQILSADKFLIATGASPNIIPFKGIDKIQYLTNVEAMNLENVPASMIILGGRAQALEFAQMYAHFGTQITILQRSQRILPIDEPEVSEELTQCLRNEGIVIYTGVQIQELAENKGTKVVKCRVNGKNSVFEAEQLLIATGRTPNTDNIGLEKAGVETEKSYVKVNEYFQTSNPNIYAAGDCVTPMMLETLAAKMGNIAVRNAFDNTELTINQKEIPSVVFTNPQVARVGYTDEEYSELTKACACQTIDMSLVPKAQIISDTRGIIKMVIDPRDKKIVGVHIVAPHAAEMIHEVTLAVKFGLTIDDIIDTVHVFPTMSEAIKLVAQSFYKDISKLSCCVE